MAITEQARVARGRRVLARVSRSAWRLAQAETERTWALASAHAEGVSIRTLATAVGLSSSRVHQLVTGADLTALDAAVGELRTAGWPDPEDPEPDAPRLISDRLTDEVDWLRRCAGWITQSDTAQDVVSPAQVAAILERIAADLDELARAIRADEMNAAAGSISVLG